MNSTTNHQQTDHVDALLRILADSERRRILASLRSGPAVPVPLEELAQLVSDSTQDYETTLIRLHHTHLPRLASADVIDYETDANTVTYHGDELLEPLLDTLQTTNAAPTPRQVNWED